MIKINITEKDDFITFLIQGHSVPTNEPCVRVTSAFEMLANLMIAYRDEIEQRHGYSKLVLYKDYEELSKINRAIRYFDELAKLYPNQITFSHKED